MHIVFLDDRRCHDPGLVGGKAAKLAEKFSAGVNVPLGFCISVPAHELFLFQSSLHEYVHHMLATSGGNRHKAELLRAIRRRIQGASIPDVLVAAIDEAYRQLTAMVVPSDSCSVAVRSSAISEDLPTASFAGQLSSFLGIDELRELLKAIRRCWASLWTERCYSYRKRLGIADEKTLMGVLVQQMIDAEVAGTIFTANVITQSRNELIIESSWGLGEAVVSGLVTPDRFIVAYALDLHGSVGSERPRATFQIKRCRVSTKKRMVNRNPYHPNEILETMVPVAKRSVRTLDDAQVFKLAQIGVDIQTLFGSPQDIEWAFANGSFYVLQSRPITTLAAADSRL